MPNTLTNVKDIKVAQSALQPFMAALLPMRAFSTNFSPEPADKLDTVRVPVVGAPSPASDFAGSYTTAADGTIDVVPVQLSRHKFKTVHVTAREAAETALNVLETLVSSAVKQLAQDVLQDIFSAITADPYGAPGICQRPPALPFGQRLRPLAVSLRSAPRSPPRSTTNRFWRFARRAASRRCR